MPPSPRRPELELLIRKKPAEDGTGGGFVIKSVAADQVFLGMRPRRSAATVEMEHKTIPEADGKGYVFRMRIAGVERYVRFTERELFLLRHMDGMHTIQDLACAWFFRFGSFDFDEIRGFLNRARKLGLVEVARPGILRSSRPQRKGQAAAAFRLLSKLERRWEGVDPAISRIHALTRPLWTPWALPLASMLVGAAGAAGADMATAAADTGLRSTLGALSLPLQVIVVLAWLFPSLLLHELAHGLACKAAGRRVKALGVTFLDRLVPTFYVDVTDIWLATRRARIAVSLAGGGANLLLASITTLAAWPLPPGAPRAGLLLATFTNLALALYTLWPFHGIRGDGYDVFSDLVRIPALRARALATLKASVRGRRPEPNPKVRRVLWLWLAATGGSWLGAAALVYGALATWA